VDIPIVAIRLKGSPASEVFDQTLPVIRRAQTNNFERLHNRFALAPGDTGRGEHMDLDAQTVLIIAIVGVVAGWLAVVVTGGGIFRVVRV
jgi:hypothetical protein